MLSSMKCASGKKAVELDLIRKDADGSVDFVVDVPNPTDILKIRARDD